LYGGLEGVDRLPGLPRLRPRAVPARAARRRASSWLEAEPACAL